MRVREQCVLTGWMDTSEAIRNRQEWSSEAIGLATLTGPACQASPRRRTSGSTRPSMAGTAAGL